MFKVTKDRQNWCGVTPKRDLNFGIPSPFDWQGELEKLKQAEEEVQFVRTSSASSSASSKVVKEEVKKAVKKEVQDEVQDEV